MNVYTERLDWSEILGRRVTLVFGGGIDAVECDVIREGSETLTVTLDALSPGSNKERTAIVRKDAIAYARIREET